MWLDAARVCAVATCRPMRFAAGTSTFPSGNTNVVDLYNSASGTWSTAQLSVARRDLAAAAVGNLAFCAGGVGAGDPSFSLHVEVLLMSLCSALVMRFA